MILSRKYAFMCVVRRCSNKIGDVDVNYKLPDVLKDIENRSSEQIQKITSSLENKIDSKFDGLGRMFKGEIGKLSGQIGNLSGQVKVEIGQVRGEIGNLSGQVKAQAIGFGIFSVFFSAAIGIFGKIVYDELQKKQDK